MKFLKVLAVLESQFSFSPTLSSPIVLTVSYRLELDQVVKSEKFEYQLDFLAKDLLRQTQKKILTNSL